MFCKKYIVALVAIAMQVSLQAQNPDKLNVTTTAVPFLRIPPDTRAAGMGSAAIAAAPDVNAVYYNIARLPFSEQKTALSANYSPWLKQWANDMYFASLAGFHKISEREAIHASLRYFNLGNIRFTDINGSHLQAYDPYEASVDLGYSRKLSERISIGLGLKYIVSALMNGQDYKKGTAVAADLGFYYDAKNGQKEGWSFGAQLSNLGSKISYNKGGSKSFIPANIGLGTAYTLVFNEQSTLNFALDVNKLLVPAMSEDSATLVAYHNKSVMAGWFSSFSNKDGLKDLQVSAGAEYWYNNLFALRAGYFYEDKHRGNRSYFSSGVSLKYDVFVVNFAYLLPGSSVAVSPLSNTLLFGVTINF